MNKEFVKYEQALALKELGFDERCFGGYEKDFSNKYFRFRGASETDIYMKNSDFKITSKTVCAPLYQQAFRWFREKYGLCSWITMELGNKSTFCWILSGEHTSTQYAAYFHTYEDAEIACLIKLIEICKNK